VVLLWFPVPLKPLFETPNSSKFNCHGMSWLIDIESLAGCPARLCLSEVSAQSPSNLFVMALAKVVLDFV